MSGSGDSPLVFTGREGCVLNTAHLALVLPWATGCVWSHCLLQKAESVNSTAEALGCRLRARRKRCRSSLVFTLLQVGREPLAGAQLGELLWLPELSSHKSGHTHFPVSFPPG